jgi:hypothetical protein
MHARVLTATVEPGRLDEVVNAVHEAVLANAKQRPGFKNVFVLTDPSTNKVMAISLWEGKEHRDAHVADGREVWGPGEDLDAHSAAGRVPKHHVEATKALTAPAVEEFYEVSFQE